MPSAHVIGTIHPAPLASGRVDLDDLTSAEIQTTRLGATNRSSAQPILVEHEGSPVGSVITSWRTSDGRLKMAGLVSDHTIAEQVRSGELRGLSIGSKLHHRPGEDPLDPKARVLHTIEEVSLCAHPRRRNCWLDEIDGKPVSISLHASGTHH